MKKLNCTLKYSATLLFLFSLPFCLFADRPSYFRIHNMTNFLNLNDTSSVTAIDKINSYYIMQDVLSLAHRIEDRANNRVHFELHLTGGATHNFESDTTNLFGAISFKFNLFNPKIPNAKDILTDIHKLYYLTEITDFEIPQDTKLRIKEIEGKLEHYNREFWWKRLSLGISVPFNELDRAYYYPRIEFEELYLFIGYDFGDIITMQTGLNKDKDLIFAASVDLSTPLHSLAVDFKDMVARLLRLPRKSSYYDYYE